MIDEPNGYGYEYEYDIFLSYNQDDDRDGRVAKLAGFFEQAGLRTFYARTCLEDHVGQPGWEQRIFDAIHASRHLGVHVTKDSTLSDWVRREVSEFRNHHSSKPNEHRILVIPDETLSDPDIEHVMKNTSELGDVLRPRDATHALQIVAKTRIASLEQANRTARTEFEQSRRTARRSFDYYRPYYRHARFWQPFTQHQHKVHVFTCGRDTEDTEDTEQRGGHGRSSIDQWDFQAAVDFTHYFAHHHREVKVKIEQPVRKLPIGPSTRTYNTTHLMTRLAHSNCITIGSPDVSDFAEVILAELLQVEPYTPTDQCTGIKFIKDRDKFSTFYRKPSETEPEGVQLPGSKSDRFVNADDRTHGVMVIADNPFSPGHKILILAGCTGVATRGMSMLLTDEESWCLDEFFELDQAIALMSGPIAAVIEVNYDQPFRTIGDGRSIPAEKGKIRFLEAIQLRPYQ
jgi:TIR domain